MVCAPAMTRSSVKPSCDCTGVLAARLRVCVGSNSGEGGQATCADAGVREGTRPTPGLGYPGGMTRPKDSPDVVEAKRRHTEAIAALLRPEIRPEWDPELAGRHPTRRGGLTAGQKSLLAKIVKRWRLAVLPTREELAALFSYRNGHACVRAISQALRALSSTTGYTSDPDASWGIRLLRLQTHAPVHYLVGPTPEPAMAEGPMTRVQILGGGTALDRSDAALEDARRRLGEMVVPSEWCARLWKTAKGGTCTVVVGEAGSGKTSAMLGMVAYLRQSVYADCPDVHVPLWLVNGNRPATWTPHDVLPVLIAVLLSEALVSASTLQRTSLTDQMDYALAEWARRYASQQLALIVDGLDEGASAAGSLSGTFGAYIPRRLPENVRLIMTCRPGPTADSLLDLFQDACQIGWSPADPLIRAPIETYVRNTCTRLGTNKSHVPALFTLADRVGWNFLLISQLLPQWCQSFREETPVEPSTVPPTLDGYYRRELRRLEATGYEGPALLEALAVAFDEVPLHDLRLVVGEITGGLTTTRFRDGLRSCEHLLRTRRRNGSQTVALRHSSVRDFMLEYLRSADSFKATHRHWAIAWKEHGSSMASGSYLDLYGVHHAAAAGAGHLLRQAAHNDELLKAWTRSPDATATTMSRLLAVARQCGDDGDALGFLRVALLYSACAESHVSRPRDFARVLQRSQQMSVVEPRALAIWRIVLEIEAGNTWQCDELEQLLNDGVDHLVEVRPVLAAGLSALGSVKLAHATQLLSRLGGELLEWPYSCGLLPLAELLVEDVHRDGALLRKLIAQDRPFERASALATPSRRLFLLRWTLERAPDQCCQHLNEIYATGVTYDPGVNGAVLQALAELPADVGATLRRPVQRLCKQDSMKVGLPCAAEQVAVRCYEQGLRWNAVSRGSSRSDPRTWLWMLSFSEGLSHVACEKDLNQWLTDLLLFVDKQADTTTLGDGVVRLLGDACRQWPQLMERRTKAIHRCLRLAARTGISLDSLRVAHGLQAICGVLAAQPVRSGVTPLLNYRTCLLLCGRLEREGLYRSSPLAHIPSAAACVWADMFAGLPALWRAALVVLGTQRRSSDALTCSVGMHALLRPTAMRDLEHVVDSMLMRHVMASDKSATLHTLARLVPWLLTDRQCIILDAIVAALDPTQRQHYVKQVISACLVGPPISERTRAAIRTAAHASGLGREWRRLSVSADLHTREDVQSLLKEASHPGAAHIRAHHALLKGDLSLLLNALNTRGQWTLGMPAGHSAVAEWLQEYPAPHSVALLLLDLLSHDKELDAYGEKSDALGAARTVAGVMPSRHDPIDLVMNCTAMRHLRREADLIDVDTCRVVVQKPTLLAEAVAARGREIGDRPFDLSTLVFLSLLLVRQGRTDEAQILLLAFGNTTARALSSSITRELAVCLPVAVAEEQLERLCGSGLEEMDVFHGALLQRVASRLAPDRIFAWCKRLRINDPESLLDDLARSMRPTTLARIAMSSAEIRTDRLSREARGRMLAGLLEGNDITRASTLAETAEGRWEIVFEAQRAVGEAGHLRFLEFVLDYWPEAASACVDIWPGSTYWPHIDSRLRAKIRAAAERGVTAPATVPMFPILAASAVVCCGLDGDVSGARRFAEHVPRDQTWFSIADMCPDLFPGIVDEGEREGARYEPATILTGGLQPENATEWAAVLSGASLAHARFCARELAEQLGGRLAAHVLSTGIVGLDALLELSDMDLPRRLHYLANGFEGRQAVEHALKKLVEEGAVSEALQLWAAMRERFVDTHGRPVRPALDLEGVTKFGATSFQSCEAWLKRLAGTPAARELLARIAKALGAELRTGQDGAAAIAPWVGLITPLLDDPDFGDDDAHADALMVAFAVGGPTVLRQALRALSATPRLLGPLAEHVVWRLLRLEPGLAQAWFEGDHQSRLERMLVG